MATKLALIYQPLSTGITYQLIPKATADNIPLHTMGYGRTSAANGEVFNWVFNYPANYWDAASVAINYLLDENGGDLNGITTIPAEIATDVADVGDKFVAAERIILDVLHTPGATVAQLRQATQEADAVIADAVAFAEAAEWEDIADLTRDVMTHTAPATEVA